MNQILVSEKIYVTQEMRKKRKIYKVIFILCLILIIILTGYYVLAEYDKNQKEQISREILEQMNNNDDTTIEEKVIVIALDDDNEEEEVPIIEMPTISTNNNTNTINSEVTANGQNYKTEAILDYSKLGISYPILSEENEELLKVSLCKYWGPNPNTIGNYCIVGHNYKSGKMFGKLSKAEIGDEVKLTDLNGNSVIYAVYNKYVVEPTDVSCTSQLTNGQREITLITCTNYGQERLVVKAKEK